MLVLCKVSGNKSFDLSPFWELGMRYSRWIWQVGGLLLQSQFDPMAILPIKRHGEERIDSFGA